MKCYFQNVLKNGKDQQTTLLPADTRRSPNVVLMLGRRRPNIKPTLGQCLMSVGLGQRRYPLSYN